MDQRTPLFQLTHLSKEYHMKKSGIFGGAPLSLKANDNISLSIYPGETLGLVGESGCGKSTLGRALLQLSPQTSGTVLYYGRSRRDVCPRYVQRALQRLSRRRLDLHQPPTQAEIAAARLIGGLVAAPDLSGVCAVYLEEYRAGAARAVLTRKREQLAVKRQLLEPSPAADALGQQLETLDAKLLDAARALAHHRAKIDDLRTQYATDPAFQAMDGYWDDGIDLSQLTRGELRALRGELQIIFQDPYASLDPRMTVEQTLCEVIAARFGLGPGSNAARRYMGQVMEQCGLDPYLAQQYPHTLSGGQRQRVGIARALALRPKFVVCDEAVSALDVSIQSQIINLLQDLKQQEALTYLFISHNLAVVRYVSDRIGVMYLGRVVELAPTQALFRAPRHPYTQALLAAIPTLDAAAPTSCPLEGDVPSPIAPPSGCTFHPRCPRATALCAQHAPNLTELDPGHLVACHHAVCPTAGPGGEG